MAVRSPLDAVRKPSYDRDAMWIFRELVRLLFQIAIGAAIAATVAGVVVLIRGGGFAHELRLTFFLFGALLLLLAGTGNRTTASRRRATGRLPMMTGFWMPSWGLVARLNPDSSPRTDVPTLTASAVFVGSGAVLIALGFFI